MEKWTESLDKYLEEGKFLLTGEIFSRKEEIGDKLKLQREESHRIALSRRRKQGVGRSFPFPWGVVMVVVFLSGIGGYSLAEEKMVIDNTAMNCGLPDDSTVQVMENSRLIYGRITWLQERKLQLLGKTFFNITKGKTFTVRTEAGDVTVLGTKFLTGQQGKKMTTNCEEGNVQIEAAVGKRALLTGEGVHYDENKIVPAGKRTEEPELPEVLGYKDDPLINVVTDIEHTFEVAVAGHEECEGLIYNGTVLTKGLNAILEKVFGSCGTNYQIRGKKTILQ